MYIAKSAKVFWTHDSAVTHTDRSLIQVFYCRLNLHSGGKSTREAPTANKEHFKGGRLQTPHCAYDSLPSVSLRGKNETDFPLDLTQQDLVRCHDAASRVLVIRIRTERWSRSGFC